jgi:MFS transporter, ACS family, hexuronate transporter
MTSAEARPMRWLVVGLLFFSTVINYLDRQTLSILARTIQNELRITDLDYSNIVQAFLLAYTIAYVGAGWLTDRLGTRLSMSLFIGWWSIAGMLTSLARGVWSLGFFRFLLGMGEPGNYTAAPKAVSEWFPPKERALAVGIYTAGATLGATIAPPLIAVMAGHFGWRGVFVVTGSLGLIWLVPWLLLYRTPPEAVAAQQAAASAAAVESPWRAAARRPETWILTVARLLTDPVWYFYLFWFPKYLTDARGLSLMGVGKIAWIPYLAADIGCILGGYFSGRLIARGKTPAGSRVFVMGLAAAVLPLSPFVALAPDPLIATLIAATAGFAHFCWLISLSALIVDLTPKHLVGIVFGIVAAGSGLGGMLSTNLVGRMVTSYSYTPVFVAMGVLHPIAFLLVRGLRRRSPAEQ